MRITVFLNHSSQFFQYWRAVAMSTNAASAGEVIGWMEIKAVDRQIAVTARAYAPDEAKIEYELKIERVGRSGKTATKQRGKADMNPGQTAQLSTTRSTSFRATNWRFC